MVVLICLAVSGRYDGRVFVAIVGGDAGHGARDVGDDSEMEGAVLVRGGVAGGGGGRLFRVRARWSLSRFSERRSLGQIVFGIYAMVLESRRRRQGSGPCLSCRS